MGVLYATPRVFRLRQSKERVLLRCLVLLIVYVLWSLLLPQATRLYKFIPTDFSRSATYQAWVSTSNQHDRPTNLVLQRNGKNGADFGERYQFVKHLGAGQEGSTDLHTDSLVDELVVIKTYRSYVASPLPLPLLRHCCGYVQSWPAEIPATQFLGDGLAPWSTPETNESGAAGRTNNMLYLMDYFITLDHTSQEWQWHLVTPFAEDGTLVQHAKSLSILDFSATELHDLLRPAFIRFLLDLHTVHMQGYCHNDIKPSNILFLNEHQTDFDLQENTTIRNRTERVLTRPWTLADFGQVREIDHPYHSTSAFRQANQLNDCVANDAKRALKTYLWLLRQATDSQQDFDAEFYMKRQSWSKVYWDFALSPGGVHKLISLLEEHKDLENEPVPMPTLSSRRAPILQDIFGQGLLGLPIAVTQELRCTSLKISWTDWWTLGGVWPRLAVGSNPFA